MKPYEKETVRAQLKAEKKALEELEKAYKQAKRDVQENLRILNSRPDFVDVQTVIHQKKYQEALLKQIDGVLNDLQTHTYQSSNDFFQGSYQNGYIGSMYELMKQGIPLTIPVDPKMMVTAIQTDSKLSKKYHMKKGLTVQNIRTLKKSIASEVTRGIASGKSWLEVADLLTVQKTFQVSQSDAMRIIRTEGNRINQQARLDAGDVAVQRGCDFLKMWDATLDSRTRPAHREADGQIVEWKDDFTVMGEKLKAPCIGGSAGNVCNCRCQLLKRPRWALDDEELEVLKERAKFYGLDKAESFEAYKEKFLKMEEIVNQIPLLIESMRSKKIWNGLPAEKRDAILKYAENGDPEFVKLAEKCMDNCNVSWMIDESGRSQYLFKTGHIDFYSEPDDETLARVFWHEYGHFVDDSEISGSGIKLTKFYKTGGSFTMTGTTSVVMEFDYEDAWGKDVDRLFKDTGIDDQFYVKFPEDKWSHPWIYIKETNEPLDFDDYTNKGKLQNALNKKFKDVAGVTDALNYKKSIGYPQDPKWEDYFEYYRTPKRQTLKHRPKFKGAEDAWYKALREASEAQDKFAETHDMEAIFAEEHRLYEEAEKRLDKLSMISDSLDESTYGMFLSNVVLGGHSSDYYRTHNHGIEGVANTFSTMMGNDPDVIKGWNEIAPNLFETLKKGWTYRE